MGMYQRLRARLDAAGLKPSTRRGQNFLLDGNLLAFIADAGGLTARDVVLEVGPGSGFLTRRLALSGALVLAVELDHGLVKVAREETEGLPNVFYMEDDILAGKNRLNPAVMAKVEEMLAAMRDNPPAGVDPSSGGPELKSVSNLPYSAGTPFVMNLFASPLPWRTGVFLLQSEVAERLVANPGGEQYGAISIAAALAAKCEILRAVHPRAFWPKPNVESSIIKVEFKPVAERLALPWTGLRRVVSAVFGSRRKILKNALKGIVPEETLEAALAEAEAPPDCRGETLSPEQFLRLAGRAG